MNCCTNSFPRRTSLFLLTLIALAAVDAQAQRRPERAAVFEKTSLKDAKPCVVGSAGEVTALVKNGVELSDTEDWDCDGVSDAYDNCVGMPNRDQLDSDHDGIGDVCEAATTVKTSLPAAVKSKRAKISAVNTHPRSSDKKLRRRAEPSRQTKPKGNRRRR
ncbi:MAG TPA: thrombospondin type 3 repeat-containing protein [Pyrinomonadaceae bacterium]|nr:thrombospondin type 3 repeat-containing protein [Pyrinomonadaceae bacterium]